MASTATAQQQPGWRDYYAAAGGPEREAQAAAKLDLYKAQIISRKATQESLSANLPRCQLSDLKACATAALDIATLENMYPEWLVNQYMTVSDLQRELNDLDDTSNRIRRVLEAG
jgi:hypothetical protein